MTTIHGAKRVWKLGKQFDRGGMGEIFQALADNGSEAVIKLIPKVPGAERELLFEELSGLPNILPILDTGELSTSWVIVMPRATKSLRKHLEDEGGSLEFEEALAILVQVANGLAVLDASVVHRDLKPDNVLLYRGEWCISDFGIARYAEASTAIDTHKFSKTPAYAAPEQWRGDRATNATDVYAFGVMAFEMVRGKLPFPGPDFRSQHLRDAPPPLNEAPPAFASLIAECLNKLATIRPSSSRLFARLRSLKPARSGGGGERLGMVQMRLSQQRLEESARQSAMKLEEEARQEAHREIRAAAERSLRPILDELKRRILEVAPDVKVSEHGYSMTFGLGELLTDPIEITTDSALRKRSDPPPFKVLAHSAIGVKFLDPEGPYRGRGHSLWFCDADEPGDFRWFELAFGAMGNKPFQLSPAALPPTSPLALEALTTSIGCQLARSPSPIDRGDEEDFVRRWMDWFGEAAEGTLSPPRQLPEYMAAQSIRK